MITLQLDRENEERLQELAKLRGRNLSELVADIIGAYLDARCWSKDTSEQWAESSTALAAEVFATEEWLDEDMDTHPLSAAVFK
jgi:predicted transcriptional regulator